LSIVSRLDDDPITKSILEEAIPYFSISRPKSKFHDSEIDQIDLAPTHFETTNRFWKKNDLMKIDLFRK